MPQRTPVQIRTIAPLCILILLTLFTGCSAVVTDAQAAGTYKAETDWGVSTLILSKDHTFDQTVRLKNGQTKHLNGTWRITSNSGDPAYTTINLSPFYNVTHDKQGQFTLASAFSIYHVPFGGINIAGDPDYGIAHRK
jgi:hypothetical protein